MENKAILSEVSAIADKMTPAIKWASDFEVSCEDDAAQASLHLAKLKTSYDVIEKKRTDATKPLNQAMKEINSWFKPITAEIAQARKVLGDKILLWKRAENEKIAKEEARRQAISDAAAAKRGEEENTKVIEVERVEKTIGMATTRLGLKKFRVVDFEKIPAEFKVVDEVKLNAYIRDKANEGKVVQGIEIYQEEILSTRGGF